MKPRHLILIIYLFIGFSISFFVWSLEPYSGDLTRIGGYSENDHGWNLDRLSYTKSKVSKASNLDDYNHPFDIVVIGDSFSDIPLNGPYDNWQEHLVRETGMSLVRFHHNQVKPQELLDHPIYLNTPPKLLLFEVVEHGLQDALTFLQNPKYPQVSNDFQQILYSKKSSELIPMTPWPRPNNITLKFDTAVHFLKTNLKQLFSSKHKALSFQLSTPCFSSQKRSTLLTYYGDLRRNNISEKEWDLISRRFASLTNLLGNQKQTQVVLMFPPDKSSVYSPFIVGDHPFKPGIKRLNLSHTKTLNLLQPLQEGAKNGQLDIYLPNDTHWGSAGHKIVADAILEQLFTSLSSEQRR